MQPIHLKLEYFGPYEMSTIDFSCFYTQSLFLITGKTGAGKTTIFDGMSYALYGSTSGGLRQGKEMRSNFAPADQKTKITFTFKQDNQTFKIEREPEQIVKKLRGEGFRESPATVKLSVFNENNEEVNQLTKQKEVAEFLSQLLQLNEKQFSQIVMLPQGDFRQFLVSDSDAKEKVLRKLFDTYFYQDVADYLKQKKKTHEIALKEINQELLQFVSQLDWQGMLKPEELSTLYYRDILAKYQQQEIAFLKSIETLRLEIAKIVDEQRDNEEKWQSQKKISDLFKEQKQVLNDISELHKQTKSIEILQKKVATLLKIQKLEPLIKQVNQLKEEELVRQKKKEELTAKQSEIALELKKTEDERAQLLEDEPIIQDQQKRLETLELSMPLFQEQNTLKDSLLKVEKQIKTTEKQLIEKQTTHESIKDQIQTSDVFIQSETKLIEEKFRLSKKIDELVQREQVIIDLVAQQEKVKETQTKLNQKKTMLVASKEDWQQKVNEKKRLKSEWAKNQIAKLSLDLLDNEPCPVCGSLDHPNVYCGKELSLADVKELEKQLEISEKEEVATRDRVTTLENEITFKEKDLAQLKNTTELSIQEMAPFFKKETSIDQWLVFTSKESQNESKKKSQVVNQLAEIEKEKETSRLLKKDAENIGKDLKQQETELRKLADQRLQLVTQEKEVKKKLPNQWASLDEMITEQQTLQKQLIEYREVKQAIELRIDTNQRALLVIKTTLKNEEANEQAHKTKLDSESAQLSTALKADNLNLADIEQQLTELNQLKDWTNQIKEYDQKDYALSQQIKKLETTLSGKKMPDLDGLKEKKEVLEQLIEERKETLTKAIYQQKSNQTIVTMVLEKERLMKEALEELEELTQLADVLSGDGANKLSIERFVLQTYLKRVLQRANEKLSTLTNNRYQFELKKEMGSFKKNTGLEINIYDDNAGALRSVNTLSGGESFIAALSLALSLAEIIQEESGGIKIDAMFIDEGFGSLDEDALEMAIRSLESIQGEGRLIGIISHVRELKERIPQQLQIKTTADGKSYVTERLEFE